MTRRSFFTRLSAAVAGCYLALGVELFIPPKRTPEEIIATLMINDAERRERTKRAISAIFVGQAPYTKEQLLNTWR